MAKLIRERFTNAIPNAAITSAHYNGGYAARLTAGGDMTDSKPAVNLCGSAADANEIYGEIKGGIDGNTVSVQTCGIMRLRTTGLTAAQINAAVGQGVQASTTAAAGSVENTGTLGVGFGRIIGTETEGTVIYAVVDADAKG